MLGPEATQRLVDRYKTRQGLVIDRASALVEAEWSALGSWDRADIERFVEVTQPHLSAAKKAAIVLAVAFYSTILQRRPPTVSAAVVEAEFNAEPAFTAVWHALSNGRPFEEAVTAGQSIANAQVSRFVQTTARRTGDHVTRQLRVDARWRRSPRANACSFCQDASHQTYRSSETADFGHDRCHCTPVPVA